VRLCARGTPGRPFSLSPAPGPSVSPRAVYSQPRTRLPHCRPARNRSLGTDVRNSRSRASRSRASDRRAKMSARARGKHRALFLQWQLLVTRRPVILPSRLAASPSALRNSLREFGRQDSPNLFAAGVRAGNRGETGRASLGHTRGCPVLLPVTLKHVRPRQRPWLSPLWASCTQIVQPIRSSRVQPSHLMHARMHMHGAANR